MSYVLLGIAFAIIGAGGVVAVSALVEAFFMLGRVR